MISKGFIVLILVVCVAVGTSGQQCFGENNGNIVIQVENTQLSAGWVRTKQIKGYSGSGSIMWNMGNQYNYQGKGILEYKVCGSGGKYLIRGMGSRPAGKNLRGDEGNDLYVKQNGAMVKLFASMGNDMNMWKSFTYFDRNHVKSMPYITLPRGCSKFVIAGRSEYFVVDVIKLVKQGMDMTDSNSMVSCSSGGGASTPRRPSGPATRPSCDSEKSTNMGSNTLFTVKNGGPSQIAVFKVSTRGSYTLAGRVRPGRTRKFRTVRKNQRLVVTSRQGTCKRRVRVPTSGNGAVTIVN